MAWHFEVITVTARRYPPGRSYSNRDKFTAVATLQVLGGKRAYLSGFLADGLDVPISRREWLELGQGLRQQFGIILVESERHGEDWAHDTGPGELR